MSYLHGLSVYSSFACWLLAVMLLATPTLLGAASFLCVVKDQFFFSLAGRFFLNN